ncbi:hypothetical protein [Pseudofrankia asymbiotica]|uniref:Uncharacterized protein n=1 Tax=Pseudofrankia asymbiotica TaxID=1834516 RepID=A0A1V2IIG0_9ACTN|nr:hypothetical protein [Pseudofrankia asymbiotica]ONH32815.1 hypothetical protein BL253_03545 [Pseudofrankia asymbiotica]
MSWRPVLALLLVAPYLGEVLSTATPPIELLLPWNLAFFAALYGCGALLCREMAHRWGLGLPGLALLGAAYGVYEEALVDRFWFDPGYAQDAGVDGYAEVWHTNLLVAAQLTAFHSAVSVCSSVLVVTWLFPGDRDRAWVRPRGLVIAGVAMLLALLLVYEEFVRPPLGPTLVALAVGILLVVAARLSRRPPPRLARPSSRRPRTRLLGVAAFVCTGAYFMLIYAAPSTGLPWPVGLAVVLVPLGIGVLTMRRWATTGPLGRDGLAVVTGILGFFIALDALVGLGGRYDLTASAVLSALALAWLRRRVRTQARAAAEHGSALEPH